MRHQKLSYTNANLTKLTKFNTIMNGPNATTQHFSGNVLLRNFRVSKISEKIHVMASYGKA